jgi:uncharacterized membrane protein
MILSLEAIVLSALILNASNRQQTIDSKMMEKDIYLGQTTKTNLDHIHDDLEELKGHISILIETVKRNAPDGDVHGGN